MSGPYEQQALSQAPGFFPGQVAGQTAGYYPAQAGGQTAGYYPTQMPGQTVTQQTVYRTTDVPHGEHAKPSGSSSSSGSYVANNRGNVAFTAAPVGEVPFYGGQVNGSYDTSYSGQRRQGRYRRQVIRLPETMQGHVRQVRHRLPTPEPDVLERVYIQRAAAEVVEEITEVPTTPPPRLQERNVIEPAGPPQVIRKTIRVPPRSGGYTTVGQGIGGFSSTGSFTNLQPSYGGFQHFGGFEGFQPGGFTGGATNFGGFTGGATNFGGFTGGATNFGGFTGGATNFGGFGSFGSGLQQPNFGLGGFQSQGLLPASGFPGANCFYV